MRLQTLSQLFFSVAIALLLCNAPSHGQQGGVGGGGQQGGGQQGGGQQGGGQQGGAGSGVAGIDIDAAGVLRVSQVDPSIAFAERRATLQNKPRGSVRTSAMRMVSLNRLERFASKQLEQGKPLSDEVKSLAGLCRLEYVFYLPESRDIVIAGPADQWHLDANHRLVGLTSGRPTLRLDDLVVALRAFAA
ncbi:MAG TPA: hypothetical protein VM260_18915, partial [Pirellula sp.]|nr:hypothetical protein [Pirellula sp.]